jgi:hypothetical protein
VRSEPRLAVRSPTASGDVSSGLLRVPNPGDAVIDPFGGPLNIRPSSGNNLRWNTSRRREHWASAILTVAAPFPTATAGAGRLSCTAR